MEWAKLSARFVRSATFALASDAAAKTWVHLIAYCADQENAGIVEFGPEWSNHEWMVTIGVTAKGIEEVIKCGLATVDGRHLRIAGYVTGAEEKAAAARRDGALGGRPPKQEPLGFGPAKPGGFPREEERRGEKKREDGDEPAERASPLPAASQDGERKILTFETIPGSRGGATEWHLTERELAELQEVFPGIDCAAEAKAAKLWVRTNPARRKTAAGMMEFLRRWISRSVNNGKAKLLNGSAPRRAAGGTHYEVME
jgi:hypothetical protein